MNALNKAIKHFGSKASLARAIGVEPMSVRQWEKRRVPADRAKDIEIATNGVVTRGDLRPDLFEKA